MACSRWQCSQISPPSLEETIAMPGLMSPEVSQARSMNTNDTSCRRKYVLPPSILLSTIMQISENALTMSMPAMHTLSACITGYNRGRASARVRSHGSHRVRVCILRCDPFHRSSCTQPHATLIVFDWASILYQCHICIYCKQQCSVQHSYKLPMNNKWKIYWLTFFTYAVIHSGRTLWSTLKNELSSAPFNFPLEYLAAVDMLVLFSLAISMSFVGPRTEQYGPKKFVMIGMIVLVIIGLVLGTLLAVRVTSKWSYLIIFGIGFGIGSCVGWPACLYMVSRYFNRQNGIALAVWNGTSQTGDLIALGASYILTGVFKIQSSLAYFLFVFILIMMLLLDYFLINPDMSDGLVVKKEIEQFKDVELPEEKQEQSNEKNLKKLEGENKESRRGVIVEQNLENGQASPDLNPSIVRTEEKLSWVGVWALPGVALCVLSYGLIKSVNSIIVSWLLFYLVEIDLASEAFSIVMMWAASVFIGGIICAIVNRSYRKEIFIAELFCAAVLFLFLKEFHRQASDKIIALIIVVCGLCYGGPYNLISTAIPIILGSQKGVENLPRAKSAIISLMEGFGQLMCGISLLFVPEIGVMNIHLVGSVYCGAAALLLLGEVVREHFANRSLRPSEKPLVPA